MKYMGSKRRIAKDILKVMLEDIGDNYFVDCFCGGGNLIMYANCKNKIASDINPYVIQFFKRLQKEGTSWLPKNNEEFTKDDYNYMNKNKKWFCKSILGYVGYAISFGGKWFSGWCSDSCGKRDYVAESYRNACKQLELIKDVKFICSPYDKLDIPENSIIYADPPYKNTTKYDAVDEFDHEKFYNWCRLMKSKGYKIYVSEYNMPDDFKCIWEKDLKITVAKDSNNKVAVEKLWTL